MVRQCCNDDPDDRSRDRIIGALREGGSLISDQEAWAVTHSSTFMGGVSHWRAASNRYGESTRPCKTRMDCKGEESGEDMRMRRERRRDDDAKFR